MRALRMAHVLPNHCESDVIVKKSLIRKEVKSTNEEETRKKRIMIFNLKNKTGKSDVECVWKDGCRPEL